MNLKNLKRVDALTGLFQVLFHRDIGPSPVGRSSGGERDQSAPTAVRMILLKVIIIPALELLAAM